MIMEEICLAPLTLLPKATAEIIVAQQRGSLELARRDLTVALERRRRELERALHDGAQQQLLALRMQILSTADEVRTSTETRGGTDGVTGLVANLVARLDGALEDLGRLASGQPPRALDAKNLSDALRDIAAISGATADVRVPSALVVDETSAEVIAFVVSEALANSQQHSLATHSTVQVVPVNDGLRVDVTDNGRGGAIIVAGRGIDGLRRRAEALGGTLEVVSDARGTLVRLQLPHPTGDRRTPLEKSTAEPLAEPAIRTMQRLLGDDDLRMWFWCDSEEPDGPSDPDHGDSGAWRDEDGVTIDLAVLTALIERLPERAMAEPTTGTAETSALAWHTNVARPVRLTVDGRPLAVVLSSTDIDQLTAVTRRCLPALAEAQERAKAAATLHRLREEHGRIARRSVSFEEALRRRLTDRPREELLAARAHLLSNDSERTTLAAECVAKATEVLREIVRRLRVPDGDWTSEPGSLTATLERIAGRARVRIDLTADDLEDTQAASVIERVAEEVMLDAPPGADMSVRVRARSRMATLSITVDRLPSPVATALLEELALSSGSTLTFRPSRDGVRLMLETPCAL